MPAWGPQPHQIGSLTQAGSAWGTQPHQIGSLALIRGGGGTILKPQDVFATNIITAVGGQNTVVNGFDFVTKRGLVLHKNRSSAFDWRLTDTVRGAGNYLITNTINSENTNSGVLFFNNNGFVHSGYGNTTDSLANYSMLCAPKFFDIVTWTGDGTSNRQIPHSLGAVPGMIIVKNRSAALDWFVYHQSVGAGSHMLLNTSGSSTSSTLWNSGPINSTVFTVVGGTSSNAAGNTYVAYLFAHDASADGIVQCGSFTTDASGNASISLSWTPQWGIFKSSSAVSNWFTLDTARGWGAGVDNQLNPNTSNAESTATDFGAPLAGGGFSSSGIVASGTVIYAVIRAPY